MLFRIISGRWQLEQRQRIKSSEEVAPRHVTEVEFLSFLIQREDSSCLVPSQVIKKNHHPNSLLALPPLPMGLDNRFIKYILLVASGAKSNTAGREILPSILVNLVNWTSYLIMGS